MSDRKFALLATAGIGAFLAASYGLILGMPIHGEPLSHANYMFVAEDFWGQLWRVLTIGGYTSNRLRPLSFLPSFFNFLIFRDNFFAYHVFILLCHCFCVYALLRFLAWIGTSRWAQALGASFFGLNYSWIDMFTSPGGEIQMVFLLSLLASLFFFIRAVQRLNTRDLILHYACGALAFWLYEHGIGIFAADMVFCAWQLLYWRFKGDSFEDSEARKRRDFFLRCLFGSAAAALVALSPYALYYWLEQFQVVEPESNTRPHWGIGVNVLRIFKWTVLNGLGFERPFTLRGGLHGPFTPLDWNGVWNWFVLGSAAAFLFYGWKSLRHDAGAQSSAGLSSRALSFYLMLVAGATMGVICYVRSRPGEDSFFLLSQQRYYYFASWGMVLTLMPLWSVPFCAAYPWSRVTASVLTAVMLLGNTGNFIQLSSTLVIPKKILTTYHEWVAQKCRREGRPDFRCRLATYWRDSYNWRIPEAGPFASWIYTGINVETPGSTNRKTPPPFPPSQGLVRIGSWTAEAFGEPGVFLSDSGGIRIKTEGRGRALLISEGLPPEAERLPYLQGLEALIRLRLNRGPSWDHQASFFLIEISEHHHVRLVFYPDYVEFFYGIGWAKAYRFNTTDRFHEYRLTVIGSRVIFFADGKMLYDFPLPKPLTYLQPVFKLGDLSWEDQENMDAVVQSVEIKVF